MNHYELLLIVSTKIPEQEQESALTKVRETLQQTGVNITDEDLWGRQKLMYEIAKQRYGVYMRYEFDAEQDAVKKIDEALRLLNEIIRFMIVQKRVKTEAEIAQEQRAQERIKQAEEVVQAEQAEAERAAAQTAAEEKQHKQAVPATEAPADAKKESKDESKIKLEDLDEKLDEILKEDI